MVCWATNANCNELSLKGGTVSYSNHTGIKKARLDCLESYHTIAVNELFCRNGWSTSSEHNMYLDTEMLQCSIFQKTRRQLDDSTLWYDICTNSASCNARGISDYVSCGKIIFLLGRKIIMFITLSGYILLEGSIFWKVRKRENAKTIFS